MRPRALPSLSRSSLIFFSPPKPYLPFSKRFSNSRPFRPQSLVVTAKSLDESDVGISCFLSSLPGFRGILKRRYFDFVVNEVDPDGNTVRLTSFDLPPEELEEKIDENTSSNGKDHALEIESLRLLCGDVDAAALKMLLEKILSAKTNVAPLLLSPDPDKSHRAQHSFGFAGTKDKCSISTQRVTVFKQRAKRLDIVNRRLFGVKVGNFCYTKEELVLGHLAGNNFVITLRDVSSDCKDTIKAAADGLRKNGFINYYGLQLQYLKRCPGNYLQALKAIPRTLRMMYIHSYQSYLWNHAASMRVKKYGISQVVLGDLVLCKENSYAEVDSSERSEHEDGNNARDNCYSDLSDQVLSEEDIHFVKVIDSEDLRKGLYTFKDVLLPLPGSTILYPANDVANVYHELAKKVGDE
ncbi:hypothetical protein Cni_G16721 [Canna indica]|uniref:TRUD domain-containing protein n=1 Tax=Canna indica TaxID=4628 RepID=A0AAQ3KI55_9LILI|nr:hypothetical protein Cni_G16721 [Canna indica]